MTYGMIIRNQNDEIQIDGEYRNYTFRESGTLSNTNDVPQGFNVPIGTYDLPPIVGYTLSTNPIAFTNYNTDSNNNINGPRFFLSGNTSTEYVVAGPSSISLPTYGMAVYDANGKVVFSSEEKPLNIETFYPSFPGLCVDGEWWTNCSDDTKDFTVQDAYNNYFALLGCDISLICHVGATLPGTMYISYYSLKIIDTTTVRLEWACLNTDTCTNNTSNVVWGFTPYATFMEFNFIGK